MTTEVRTSRSRVIVAVGPAAADTHALAAAARLASVSGAELAAVFVEDINLLRLAELPFAFETGSASGTSRPLVSADLERSLRSQADKLKRAFSELASALPFNLSFEIARGHPTRALLAASGSQDLVVLSSATKRSFTHVSAPNVLREVLQRPALRLQSRAARPVIAALQSIVTAPRMLAAAHALARATTAELMLLLAGGQENAELESVVRDWLAMQRTNARIMLLPGLTPESASALAAESGTHALFWTGDEESAATAGIDTLLTTITCPLVIVR